MKNIQPIQPAKLSFKNGLPFSDSFNDTYFSTVGAVAEKTHVFLKGNQLAQRFESLQENVTFVIAELGFGLAVNFLLTWQLWQTHAPENSQLHFISTELNPLIKEDLTHVLCLFPELSFYANQLLSDYPTLTPGSHRLNFGSVSLTLLLGDAGEMLNEWVCDSELNFQKELRSFTVDAWYFDGFSPQKNPALWENDLLNTVRLLSDTKTTLTSYSVASSFKKALESSGFCYRKEKGIGKKREFIWAQLIELDFVSKTQNNKKRSSSPWHSAKNNSPLKRGQTIAVVGAGLAGCLMAYRLAERGFSVTLFEKENNVATKGSGNAMGMVHFKLSPYHTPLNDYMLSAFLYAIRFYQSMNEIELRQGIADLLPVENHLEKQTQFVELANAYPELIQFLSSSETRKIAGINLSKPSMYWPTALMFSPVKLCQYLCSHKKISIESKHYNVEDRLDFDNVIICSGTSTADYQPCEYLPLELVSGMVSYVKKTNASRALKIGLSEQGYLTPSNSLDIHIVGGSYHVLEVEKAHQEHLEIAVKISQDLSDLNVQSFSYKYGERAKTYDYLPYVGALPNVPAFNKQYAPLSKDKNKRINKAAPYDCTHYVLTGFGSHGLTTIPLSVEIVLSQLFNEPLPVSQSLLKAISPARSLIRTIVTGKS